MHSLMRGGFEVNRSIMIESRVMEEMFIGSSGENEGFLYTVS